MNAIIQQFQNELTAEERRLFEANAALAGRRPGVHLKCILFGERPPERRGRPRRTEAKPKPKPKPKSKSKAKPKGKAEDGGRRPGDGDRKTAPRSQKPRGGRKTEN
ncbi:hypothetical protein SAMN02745166_02203 [Prosthecobacter debontii]|uniref:Uncharacterized protein n=1 Tax=Prosthecobacter debontii TaxID=48467 RepID=A0A1T4Y0E7_9BACT|nr:hypothetical protein SAMN02745166_02203 [Prosthecobacter debontii]